MSKLEEVVSPAAIERALGIYQQLQPRDQSILLQARKILTQHIYGMIDKGEFNEQRLTVGGLAQLKAVERDHTVSSVCSDQESQIIDDPASVMPTPSSVHDPTDEPRFGWWSGALTANKQPRWESCRVWKASSWMPRRCEQSRMASVTWRPVLSSDGPVACQIIEVSTGLLEAEFFPFVGQPLDKRILIVEPARKCEQFML
jgi:hypothetical protein